MALNKAYCIPGMGLDQKVFKRLKINNYDLVKLKWIEPERKESLARYAIRFIEKFNIQMKSNDILIGHSFGGILAQEIASQIGSYHVFVISSIKSPKELPLKIKILNKGPFLSGFKKSFIKYTFPIWKYSHDYDTKEKQALFYNCIDLYSDYYFIWGIDQIIRWKPNADFQLTHIHGTTDKTFPIKLIHNAHEIEGGSHLMLLSEFQKINLLIEDTLSERSK